MINELAQQELPKWLSDITESSPLPNIYELLIDSLYYPACGFNGTPVKYLAGNIYSFVYADYGINKEDFLQNLNGNGPDCGFKNYHSICQREIYYNDIVPKNWRPTLIPSRDSSRIRLLQKEQSCTPFAHWSVWHRNPTVSDECGPIRFSFFFLAGEMSAIYQGLYCRLNISPKILAVIQPGSFGGEWENAAANDSFFKRVVSSNRAGLPEYLLHGGFGRGFYEEPCWWEYNGQRLVQLPERYAGLWKLNCNIHAKALIEL